MNESHGKRSEEIENLEALESLEPVDEAEPVSPGTVGSKARRSTSAPTGDVPHLPFLESSLQSSPFPYIVINADLEIEWENSAYLRLFSLPADRPRPTLTDDFPTAFPTEKLAELRSRLADPEAGYAYRGQIESFHPHRLSVLANLSLTPIFAADPARALTRQRRSPAGAPRYYLGAFDDVTAEQRSLLQNTFISLLEASKLKDNDTGMHIQRVGEYSRLIAEQLFETQARPEVSRQFVSSIAFLAPMHDVGKIGTPDDILNKEGSLDEREWEVMREHTINGAYILSSYPDPMARQIALFHHEQWDGSGYPYKMAEEMIPLPARIVAIADVYDALRMSRSYKEPFSHRKAISIMESKSGSHFDPQLLEIFLGLESRVGGIYEQLRDREN
jgi:putative two-component system response regulator